MRRPELLARRALNDEEQQLLREYQAEQAGPTQGQEGFWQ
jgi:hypothetical protein